MAVGPVRDDVLRMRLVHVLPLLAGVDAEVEVVGVGQVAREFGRHACDLRRGLAGARGGPRIAGLCSVGVRGRDEQCGG